jgi:antitoxin (DNA-binding transcriptional repressor) of toxin-antitoxin stability system
MNATIVDLRYRMRDVLRAIDRGETVTVLYRGKAKATLMPISPALDASHKGAPKTADQPLFGLWNDRDDLTDPASYVRNLRQPRAVLGETGIKRHRSAGKPK